MLFRSDNTSHLNSNNSSQLNNISLNTRLKNTRFNDDVFHLDSISFQLNNDAFHLNNASFNNNGAFRSNNASFAASTLPASFHEMDNIHQICSWLCANPSVLLLAYNMYLSMQTPVSDGFNFVSSTPTFATTTPYIPKQEDKVTFSIKFSFYFHFFLLLTSK